jgi:GPH family glycoside/pentoside/hexuronide:cation symporter
MNAGGDMQAVNGEFAKISMKEKLSYCLGDPALTAVYTLTVSLLIYFYTNAALINAALVGIILLVSKIFDGFSDVLMGLIVDKTRSRYGKARVWILRMLIPYLIAPTLLMCVPDAAEIYQAIYIFFTYNFMNTIVYTAISQPFHALGARLTRDRAERDMISNIRMAMSIGASMIITAFMLPLVNMVAVKLDNVRMAWIVVTAGISVVSLLILLNTFFATRERVTAAERSQEKIASLEVVKLMITNRYFLIAAGLMLFFSVYQVIASTILTYYCQYIMGNVNLIMPLSMAEKLPMIILILCLPKISKRFGKRALIMGGCVISIAGQLMLPLNVQSLPLAIAAALLRGIGMAPFYGYSYSLPNDAIEYGHWKSGKRVEALMFSSMQFGQKFGSGMASALLGIVLANAGFNGTAALQSASVNSVIRGLFLYVPVVVWVIMLVIAAFYALDGKYDAMIQSVS